MQVVDANAFAGLMQLVVLILALFGVWLVFRLLQFFITAVDTALGGGSSMIPNPMSTGKKSKKRGKK